MKIAKSKWLLMLGISVCALCCALLIIGAVMGITALAALGVWLEKASAVLVGLSAVFFLLPLIRKLASRMNAPSCTTDCSCNPEAGTFRKNSTQVKG